MLITFILYSFALLYISIKAFYDFITNFRFYKKKKITITSLISFESTSLLKYREKIDLFIFLFNFILLIFFNIFNLLEIAYCSSEEVQKIFIRNLKIESNDLSVTDLLKNEDSAGLDTISNSSILSNTSLYDSQESLQLFREDFNMRKNHLYTTKSFSFPYIKGVNFDLTQESFLLVNNLIHEQNFLFNNNRSIIETLNNFDTEDVSLNRVIVLLDTLKINNSDLLIEANNAFIKTTNSYVDHVNSQQKIKLCLLHKLQEKALVEIIVNDFLNLKKGSETMSLYTNLTKNLNIYMTSLDFKLEKQILYLENIERSNLIDESIENFDYEEQLDNILSNPNFQNLLNFHEINPNNSEYNLQNYIPNHLFFLENQGLDEKNIIENNKLIINFNKIDFYNSIIDNSNQLSDDFYNKQENLNNSFFNLYRNNQNGFIDFIIDKSYTLYALENNTEIIENETDFFNEKKRTRSFSSDSNEDFSLKKIKNI